MRLLLASFLLLAGCCLADAVPQVPWKYIGCYADMPYYRRDLWLHIDSKEMSLEKCHSQCKKYDYNYFGVQAAKHCFCGNSYGRYGKKPESQCNKVCDGNASQICGGIGRNSVYTTGEIIEVKVKNPTYMGCFKDEVFRAIPFYGLEYNMTIENCNRECTALKFAYFGLRVGTHCFCGNSYDMYGEAPNSECNLNCDGNKNQKCGGDWGSSVYKTNFVPKFPWQYIGCYADKTKRDLPLNIATNKMSLEKCNSRCKKLGHKFFGVQAAKFCFCGDSYGSYGKEPDSECNWRCDGNTGQHCGGGWRNSVYKIKQ